MNSGISVQMFGSFVISGGDKCIDDTQNRSKKVWSLLAILFCNRGRVVTQNELIDLLWSDDADGGNSTGTLKTTLHRARALLEQAAPDHGHKLIISKNGGYTYNEEIPLSLDTDKFEALCASNEGGEDEELERLKKALELYRGGFLSKLSSELWVISRSTYYHNLYIQAVNRALELMETRGLCNDAEAVCRGALKHDPYQENLYQHLMRNLIAMGRQPEAATVYEDMSKLLLADFGIMPDAESRSLYREALRTVNTHAVAPGIIREQLRETDPINGALICDYDFFKMIYQAEARMVARSGSVVHLLLLSLVGYRGKELAKRSLDPAMDNMQEILKSNLRKGDVITRCSTSQFLVMLPRANFENSEMVCNRVIKAFSRKYPHSPAMVETAIYPIEPSVTLEGIPASDIK